MHVLLISGSLRARSTNTAALRTATELAPQGVVTIYDGLGALPHFNPDDDHEPVPEPVAALRAAVHAAGAILFSVPEYAGALPGSFKNLLDWLIGDAEPGSVYEKPVAWLNVSTRGACNAHAELRTVLGFAHATIVEPACIHIPVTEPMIDADGTVTDANARDQILVALAELARHL
jgi:NAD(P)H-dependent FMN reductase